MATKWNIGAARTAGRQEEERLDLVFCPQRIDLEIDHPDSEFFNIKQLKENKLFSPDRGLKFVRNC